jgi:hypothetical protein
MIAILLALTLNASCEIDYKFYKTDAEWVIQQQKQEIARLRSEVRWLRWALHNTTKPVIVQGHDFLREEELEQMRQQTHLMREQLRRQHD